jgi:hypothetical protein
VIPAEVVGAPCDIEVESCAVWGVPASDDFALGMGLTLTTADCASKLYDAINFQEYGWKMLSGRTIYFVHGSGTAADTLKRAITNHDFKYYDDAESIKAVGDLPNGSTTRPAAIAVVKPSEELIGFIGKYADPRYFDQVNTTLSQLNVKLMVGELYSPSHIDIAKIMEIIEGGGSISSLNLGLLMSVESNHPGFLVEPAVRKFLADSGFTEMNFAGVTIYKGDLDRYVGEAIPALVWIKGNRVFAAIAGQESYAQSLISRTIAHALPAPPPTPIPTPGSNQPPQISSLVASPSGILCGGSTTLTCIASDPDGDMVRYTWSAIEGSITGVGSEMTWTAPNKVGEYNITVAVSDSKGGEAKGNVKVTVLQPYSVTLDLVVLEGQSYVEHPFPIYLRNNQSLHLTWMVMGEGKAYFSFRTPKDGSFCFWDGTHAEWVTTIDPVACSPARGGAITIRPLKMKDVTYTVSGSSGDNSVTEGWGEGYYVMNPHSYSTVKIKVEYWIED